MTTMMPPPEKSHLAPEPDDTVLSTLNPDGSRHWIRPRVSPGRCLDRRRIVAYGLIALFAGLLISAALHFIVLWPEREPDDAATPDAPDRAPPESSGG